MNVIAPGLVATPMSLRAQEHPGIREFSETKQPLSAGFLQPGDIADSAVFLLSDEARNVTDIVWTGISHRWANAWPRSSDRE